MNTLTIQTIKTKGAKVIPDDQVTYLIVNSKPKSVFVPVEYYEMLEEALEELEDIKAIEERKGEKTVPLNKAFPAKKK